MGEPDEEDLDEKPNFGHAKMDGQEAREDYFLTHVLTEHGCFEKYLH